MSNASESQSTFQPYPFLKCPHRQTVLGVYLPGQKFEYTAIAHTVTCENGDELVMHDDQPDGWQEGDRCAIMLHGLVGCHGSPYMMRIARKLVTRGVRVFRLDLRGHGSSAMAKAIGHAGRSEDAFSAVGRVHALAPSSPITLIGFSMGGNIVLKAACEAGRDDKRELPNVDQVLTVSPPINIRVCVENMSKGFNRWYDRSFARWLCQLVEKRKSRFPDIYHQDLDPRPRSIYEFDDRFTAPLSGFKDANDYYSQCSALRLIEHLRIPTWILVAKDDPLIPFSIYNGLNSHPFVDLQTAEHGGHLGFIARRTTDPDRRWMDWRIIERIRTPQEESSLWGNRSEGANGESTLEAHSNKRKD